MDRRPLLLILPVLAAGCGGAGQSTTTAMSPMDTAYRGGGYGSSANGTTGANANVYKPTVGANAALGTLKTLSEKSPLAKAPTGPVDKAGATKLAKLGKEGLKLDDAYNYYVADAATPHATVGEKGASVPLPADAKPNPDGTVWVVDGETRRAYTLKGVKKEEGKDTTVAEAPSSDLVHPDADATAPPMALAARADEASAKLEHALRIVAKGVGAEGGPAEGARVRLKKGTSEKDATLLAKALMRALKKYGAVLSAGEGEPALSAVADPRWTKEDEKAVSALHMTDFELISTPSKPSKATKKTS